MALAYQSIGSITWTAATSIAIPKPSSLADGDLMVAIVGSEGSTNQSAPAGWTLIRRTEQTAVEMTSWYKIADATDAAASDFTFNGSNPMIGSILRFTGHNTVTPIPTSNGAGAQNTATPSFATGVTPVMADSILIMAHCSDDDATNLTTSTYAIVTSDPTWTERVDDNSGTTRGFAIATGPRSAVTSTGAWSFTLSGVTDDITSQIIVVSPPVDVTVSPAVFSVAVNVQAPTVQTGTTFTVGVVSATVNVNAPTIIQNKTEFTNTQKNATPTITNEQKSATPTITNEQKSATPTITNEQKHE